MGKQTSSGKRVATGTRRAASKRDLSLRPGVLLDAVPDAMVIVENDGTISLVNRQTEVLFGYSRDELLGQPVERLLPARFHDRHRGHRTQYAADPRTRPMGTKLDLWGLRRDGMEFPVEVSLSPVITDAGPRIISTIRDASERKHTEVALKEARHEAEQRAVQLEVTFESMTDGVFLVDVEGRLIHINSAGRRLLGIESEWRAFFALPLEERGAWFALSDSEGRLLPAHLWPTQRVLAGESLTGSQSVDISVLRPDGRQISLSTGGAPIHDSEGRRIGGVIVFRDVTERRLLERKTRDALEMLLSVAEAVVQAPSEREPGIIGTGTSTPTLAHSIGQRVVSLTRDVLTCERVGLLVRDQETDALSVLALEGFDSAEAHALRSSLERVPRLSDRFDAGARARLARGEVVLSDLRQAPFRERSAPESDGQWLVAPLRVGSELIGLLRLEYGVRPHSYSDDEIALAGAIAKLAALVLERDRLAAEQRARQAAETRLHLLQTILNELPMAVYLVRGPDARLVLANQRVTDVWGAEWPVGQPMEAFLAANDIHIFALNGQSMGHHHYATLRALRDGKVVRHHQEVVRHPDGTTLPVMVDAIPLTPTVLYGVLGPIVEDAGASEPVALVVHEDISAIKEAERLKDEFIALAAHELRNPMASLKGYAQALTRTQHEDESATLTEWQRESLATIEEATNRLVALTDDLFDVTRLEAGRLELALEPHDLGALVRRVIRRMQITTTQHTLRLDAAPDYTIVWVDARRIEQVVTNLVSNAIKYSPDGGDIEIRIRDLPDGFAELSVRDHGMGIPASQQGMIFGRFARAENARSMGVGGTGLGLYLCRELVDRHGGKIWFDSSEERGTAFFVLLPLAAR